MATKPVMNKRFLGKIARWLESGGEAVPKAEIDHFDMGRWRSKVWSDEEDCGTACCIAGAAVQFDDPNTPKTVLADQRAKELLGLTGYQAVRLFTPDRRVDETGVDSIDDIDAAWAARTIRKLITTGRVDWSGTRFKT